jgi:asparagine synthase (glutamine-hydrolysing)
MAEYILNYSNQSFKTPASNRFSFKLKSYSDEPVNSENCLHFNRTGRKLVGKNVFSNPKKKPSQRFKTQLRAFELLNKPLKQFTHPMCGITGIVNFNKEKKIEQEVLKRMADTIHHRGPDDEGYYIQQNVGLAFRRLSIIDLHTGHQPLSNHDDSIHIIFNGEIYNYLEHRERLKGRGYSFKTTTDTEVILHLYEEHGTDCLQYMRGMFAFAIWDNNRKQLFCARDHFGIKPFYYYADNDKFIFGSEIKAILNKGDIDKTLSYEALNSFFAFGYITNNHSIYTKIKKLQPAHYLLLSLKDEATIEIRKYWNIDFEPDYSKSEEQWINEINDALSETVKLQMKADVPLGAFLSGGIDSSAVVAAMAKNSTRSIETFSIGFKQEKYNELKFAKEIAQKYNCNHHEQIVEPESIGLLPRLVEAYDEPFADSSAIPTYYVSKFASEHVKVALSGDGGDELFAGYSIYSYLLRIHRYNVTPTLFNESIWGTMDKLTPQSLRKTVTYLMSKNRNYLGAYLAIWPQNERKKLILDSKIFRYSDSPEVYKEQILSNGNTNDFLANQQALDMQTYMVDDILTKVDRASMLNSLEVRVPLLDHKFAELSFRIPTNLKLKGNEKKYIFRQSLRSTIPGTILNRPKTGFSIPLSAWFKDELSEYINDTLFSGKPLLSDYLDWNYIKSTGKDYKGGGEKLSAKIWSLIWFEEWLKQQKKS